MVEGTFVGSYSLYLDIEPGGFWRVLKRSKVSPGRLPWYLYLYTKRTYYSILFTQMRRVLYYGSKRARILSGTANCIATLKEK